ncbi:MAG: isoprenyl transferase [Rickettsiales bacterium]|nr:MAG: isoprenyl transferase [Rickettsiales bacterium]
MQHIAFIMDGNRRWAKNNGLSVKEGHEAGLNKVSEVIKMAKKKDIKYFTIYTFSNENWNRSIEEVTDLMNMIEEYLDTKRDEFREQDIKVKVIGRKDKVRKSILEKIASLEEETKNCKSMQVNIAFNYGGKQEIIDIVKKIVNNKIAANNIDEKLFNSYLYYGSDVPEPDLIVRTSGEQRVSNFLLWEMAYSELYFTKTHWPDFNEELFDEILDNYNNRERRHGK